MIEPLFPAEESFLPKGYSLEEAQGQGVSLVVKDMGGNGPAVCVCLANDEARYYTIDILKTIGGLAIIVVGLLFTPAVDANFYNQAHDGLGISIHPMLIIGLGLVAFAVSIYFKSRRLASWYVSTGHSRECAKRRGLIESLSVQTRYGYTLRSPGKSYAANLNDGQASGKQHLLGMSVSRTVWYVAICAAVALLFALVAVVTVFY